MFSSLQLEEIIVFLEVRRLLLREQLCTNISRSAIIKISQGTRSTITKIAKGLATVLRKSKVSYQG
jgi:hypothetical protein